MTAPMCVPTTAVGAKQECWHPGSAGNQIDVCRCHTLLLAFLPMTPEEIKRLRTRLGLTQEGLARELGVSVSTVHKWERGRARPRGLSVRALQELAQRLDGTASPSQASYPPG